MGLRAARIKAYAEYMDKLHAVEPADKISRLNASNSARALERQYGSIVSGRVRSEARKADKVGRAINKNRGEFNSKIEDFNTKLDLLKERMAGKDVTDKVAALRAPLEAKAKELSGLIGAKINAEEQRAPQDTWIARHFGGQQKADSPEVAALKSQYAAIQQKIRGYGENTKPLPATYPVGTDLIQIEDAVRTMAFASGEANGKMRLPDPANEYIPPEEAAANKSYGIGTLGNMGGGPSRMQATPTGMSSIVGSAPKKDPNDPSTMVADPSSSIPQLKTDVEKYGALADKIATQVETGAKRAAITQARSPATGLLGSELVGNSPADLARVGRG